MAASSAKYVASPPWKTTLLRWLSSKIPLKVFYRRVGWTDGIKATRSRCPDLRISQAAKMADALGAPRGRFLETLCEDLLGPPEPMERISRKQPISANMVMLTETPGGLRPGRPAGRIPGRTSAETEAIA